MRVATGPAVRFALVAAALAGALAGCQPARHEARTTTSSAAPQSGAAESALAAPDSASLARADSLTAADRAIEPGRTAYLESCAMCHGPRGGGDGPLAPDIVHRGGRAPTRLDDSARVAELGVAVLVATILDASHSRTRLAPPWAAVEDSSVAVAIAGFVPQLSALDSMSAAAIDHRLAEPAGAPERGRLLYATECAVCHGATGRGDGRLAGALWASHHVRPRDLTDAAYFGKRSDADLYGVLALGGGHLGRSVYMPAWNVTLPPDRIRDLVATVRAWSHTVGAAFVPAPAASHRPRADRSRPA